MNFARISSYATYNRHVFVLLWTHCPFKWAPDTKSIRPGVHVWKRSFTVPAPEFGWALSLHVFLRPIEPHYVSNDVHKYPCHSLWAALLQFVPSGYYKLKKRVCWSLLTIQCPQHLVRNEASSRLNFLHLSYQVSNVREIHDGNTSTSKLPLWTRAQSHCRTIEARHRTDHVIWCTGSYKDKSFYKHGASKLPYCCHCQKKMPMVYPTL